jgi:hypothetical protein
MLSDSVLSDSVLSVSVFCVWGFSVQRSLILAYLIWVFGVFGRLPPPQKKLSRRYNATLNVLALMSMQICKYSLPVKVLCKHAHVTKQLIQS